ncbi:Protein cwh43 [Branchiostoma belcheri]|nr:Protein cwh43 [Branchiostoma belcheri]
MAAAALRTCTCGWDTSVTGQRVSWSSINNFIRLTFTLNCDVTSPLAAILDKLVTLTAHANLNMCVLTKAFPAGETPEKINNINLWTLSSYPPNGLFLRPLTANMAPAREKVAEGKAKKAKPAAVPDGLALVRALAAETVLVPKLRQHLVSSVGGLSTGNSESANQTLSSNLGIEMLPLIFSRSYRLARVVGVAEMLPAYWSPLGWLGWEIEVPGAVGGFIFWSLLHGFGPMIWFYPLNELEISGYEAFVLAAFTPALAGAAYVMVLSVTGAVFHAVQTRWGLALLRAVTAYVTVTGAVFRAVQTRWGLALLRVITVSCVASFQAYVTVTGAVFRAVQTRWGLALLRSVTVGCVASFQAPSTLARLVVLAMGNAAAMLVIVGTLWNKSNFQRTVSFWGLMLGFFALLAGRVWYTSLSPAWADLTTNSVVLAVGAVGIVDRALADDYENPGKDDPRPTQRPSWVLVSVGFGSLLFLTQAVYGEVSVVSRWVVTGYPDPGPAPNPWGSLVLLGLANGLLLSSSDWLTGSSLWFLTGGIGGAAAIQFLPTYQGFLGGVLLAVYTTSVWPQMSDRLVLCPPARTMVLTLAVYLVEMFGMVWCTAYNFVPLGEYTRERTYILLAISMLCIGAAMHLTRPGASSLAFLNINSAGPHNLFKKFVGPFLSIIVIGGLGGFVWRYNPEPFNHSPKNDPKEFTGLIWTFHFGYDNRGWPSFERAARMLNETGADVITLLESDASKPYLGNNDLAMWLGERLDMYTDFGVSTRDHTWGNLLLSKYPIVKSRHHMLPSPHGELAPAISATVNISGSLVDFITTHMGNDRDNLDRKLQAEFLSEIAKNSGNPVVFLGYVTSSPGSRDYRKLLNNGGMKDIDSTDRDRWCEYIMYKKLIRLGYARVSHGGLSDTEVQMAKFRIPTDLKNYKDNDKLTTNPAEVEPRRRFTDRFGSFFRGHSYSSDHHYHMDTPKYFLP